VRRGVAAAPANAADRVDLAIECCKRSHIRACERIVRAALSLSSQQLDCPRRSISPL
jgi:hypothetical protein